MKLRKYLRAEKLSRIQLIIVSEIARDGAQIIFGGLVIAQAFLEGYQTSWLYFMIGTVATIGLWILSVIILKDESK